jgi:hypothetical protein
MLLLFNVGLIIRILLHTRTVIHMVHHMHTYKEGIASFAAVSFLL